MQSRGSPAEVNLDEVFAALRRPLDLIDNAERRLEFERFVEAARVHQERAIFDLVAAIVGDISAASGTNIRLEYAGGRLRVVVDESVASPDATASILSEDGQIDRVTIRLPARLKAAIDQLAAAGGTSVNSWYVHTLFRAAARQMRHARPLEEADRPSTGRPRGRRRPPASEDFA